MPIDSKYLASFECGEYYHVYNRSHSNTKLFYEPENYSHFWNLFKKHLTNYVDLYAYCLIPNHFHLFIKIKDELSTSSYTDINKVISNQFRKLFIAYASSINKAYNRHGGLFVTPFRRLKIDSESYFSEIIFYIHSNPVHHGICLRPEDYLQSSYLSILSHKPTLLKRQEVLAWFGSKEIFIKFHIMQSERFTTFPFEIEERDDIYLKDYIPLDDH